MDWLPVLILDCGPVIVMGAESVTASVTANDTPSPPPLPTPSPPMYAAEPAPPFPPAILIVLKGFTESEDTNGGNPGKGATKI
jgi:hypothetical protein